MTAITETSLWKSAFESADAQQHLASVGRLVTTLLGTREQVAKLVGEIAVDLPQYTVHTIEHLDALWEIAGQITGPHFPLNPVEGFILGVAFLLHDAGMTLAAYPGGMAEVEESNEWKRLLGRLSATVTGELDKKSALEIFLREQHARQAGRLPFVSWKSAAGNRFLIDDAEARDTFGELIGLIAASHWWDHSKIEEDLGNRTIPVPAPFPSAWTIDLFKLACIIRTADAAQIDFRRAPGFLFALRQNRLSNYSRLHWSFQNHMTQAQNRDDTLYFAALKPFQKAEHREWWLLYDTLKMVDSELRRADDMLFRLRGNAARFACKKVANIDSPQTLRQSAPTSGWEPVETAYTVADIPLLIENLGGNQLYGQEPFVAIREVIQNAMDAVRLRQIIDPGKPSPLVDLEVCNIEGRRLLVVTDNGVGMSQVQVVRNLLSFGSSGWLSDQAIGEYSEKIPNRFSMSGRYGIGFFSVFMIANKVRVRSRRFDKSPDTTVVLEFPDGLNDRPILYLASDKDRLSIPGTEISIEIDAERASTESQRWPPARARWDLAGGTVEDLHEALGQLFPASDVPLRIVGEKFDRTIDGRNWDTEPVSVLLERIEGRSYLGKVGMAYEEAIRPIVDGAGRVVGRAALISPGFGGRHRWDDDAISGSVVANGVHVCGGRFRGVLLGSPTRAARDFAVPLADHATLSRWASQQAIDLSATVQNPKEQVELAELVASLGGSIDKLKLGEAGGTPFSADELREFLADRNEIWVAQDAGISNGRPMGIASTRTSECLGVSFGIIPLIETPAGADRAYYFEGIQLADLVIQIIREVFDIDVNVIQEAMRIEDGRYVYNAQAPAWKISRKKQISVFGHYFKRRMTKEELKPLEEPIDLELDW